MSRNQSASSRRYYLKHREERMELSGFNKAKEIKSYWAKKIYKNRCYVCRKPFGKGFAFHHKWYEQIDARYRDFNGNTDKYHRELEKFIISNPKRFLLLCKAHHHFVEWGASIKDKGLWNRFLIARRMTNT